MARIAFFGTPAFAATTLQALIDATRGTEHDVVLVVAQPDKPQGRGQKLQAPPTKVLAELHGIEVAQPTTLKAGTPDGEAIWAKLSSLDLDLAVVAAYGRIMPKRILALPKRECVNVHGSLLPRWRGSAPVQRAIEAGDDVTGVCLMHMVYDLDAGDVYVRESIPIADDDDSETLMDKLALLGGNILKAHLQELLDGALPRVPQASEGLILAPMLRKEEAKVDFDKPARDVMNHARAMVPWPGATTILDGEVLKLFTPRVVSGSGKPGTVLRVDDGLVVACGTGAVSFAEVQQPNKRRIAVRDWARGKPQLLGAHLG